MDFADSVFVGLPDREMKILLVDYKISVNNEHFT